MDPTVKCNDRAGLVVVEYMQVARGQAVGGTVRIFAQGNEVLKNKRDCYCVKKGGQGQKLE